MAGSPLMLHRLNRNCHNYRHGLCILEVGVCTSPAVSAGLGPICRYVRHLCSDRHLTTAVSKEVFDNISRYTAFSAAAYGDTCDSPPSGSKVIKYFSDEATDTQGTLFEDESNHELIMAFRGTSSPKDLDTDLVFTLVPLTATGTQCSECKVRRSSPISKHH